MIKVGFIGTVSKDWMGGYNYYKNLLYALSSIENSEIKIFVFIGKDTDLTIKDMFKEYATVIEDSLFDKKSLNYYLYKLENKFLQRHYMIERLLNRYNIDILSHANLVNLKSVKTINWIPDFQHLHLPNMFSQKAIDARNKNYLRLIQKSNKVILSSCDAFKDLKIFAPRYIDNVSILQFVSQPDKRYFDIPQSDKALLIAKYNIKDSFFYIPNQFWKHKNHMLVFNAVKLLIDEGIDISIVCTGHLNDYRNKEYIKEINNFISTNNLENNIRLLGLVDYEDVFLLIKFSVAVINPSLFEGWSSTVEECKSVHKNMILSDLDVHKEQYPEAVFFQKNSINSLKDVLKEYNMQKINNIENLETRTQVFAQKYIDIIREVHND